MKNNIKKYDEFINEEISPDLLKRSINVGIERNYIDRTYNLGKKFFNEFIGMNLLYTYGKIDDIGIIYNNSNNRFIQIIVNNYNYSGELTPEQAIIKYDIDNDLYDINFKIQRKDARILSKIAMKINPDTKYKESGKYFDIIGY
jgi:hypothetical protein